LSSRQQFHQQSIPLQQLNPHSLSQYQPSIIASDRNLPSLPPYARSSQAPTSIRCPSPQSSRPLSPPAQPPDTAYARNSRAFLGRLDDMPSATDFLAASDLGGFEEDIELPVPPQDKYPELEGEDSPRAAHK
jgi:hypothetical protein